MVDDTGVSTSRLQSNVLLIISDDVGLDQAACYDRPTTTRAPQPTLDGLCSRGVVFDRAWANPYCSPTRAGLLTGRYAFRTGVGEPISATGAGLNSDEYTLPNALAAAGTGYATAAFGKWHLSGEDNGGVDHPNLVGFDHFAGAMHGEVDDYFNWPRVEDGVETTSTDYVTSATVDDTLAWVDEQTGPWFAWVAFHAPHTPLHLPPADLHSYTGLTGSDEDIEANPALYAQAMLQAEDAELGRLFDGIGAAAMRNTVVIYIGDNGSAAQVNQGAYPSDRSKGTIYEGGVHVPMVIAGPGVVGRGRRELAPVNTLDIFSTIIELTGGSVADDVPTDVVIDSVSMLPYLEAPRAARQREWMISEVFGTRSGSSHGAQAIGDGRYKLIRNLDGTEVLYDQREDPFEEVDLIDGSHFVPAAAWSASVALSAALDDHLLDIVTH